MNGKKKLGKWVLCFLFISLSCNQRLSEKTITCDDLNEKYSFLLNEAKVNQEEILRKAKDIVRKYPLCNTAKIFLGDLYLADSNYKQAVLFFRQGLGSDPNNTYLLFKLGLSYKEQRIYDSAIILFNKAEQLKNIGGIAVDYNDQLDVMPGSIRTDVKYSDLIFQRAVANYQFGDYYNSLFDLNYCIREGVELKYSYYYRALIYARVNDREKACSDSWNAKINGNDSIEKSLLEFSINCIDTPAVLSVRQKKCKS